MDKQEALIILGLKEDATKEEIEKKYGLLCKRYKASLQNTDPTADRINMQKITEAYDVACGRYISTAQPEVKTGTEDKPAGIWKKHRSLIIGGIIVVALLLLYNLLKLIS